MSRLPVPTTTVVYAPTDDTTPPTFVDLPSATTRMVLVDPTTELQDYMGMGVQLQDATNVNLDLYASVSKVALMNNFFGPVSGGGLGINLIRIYVGSGAFLHQKKGDGSADYYTPCGPLSDFTAQTTALEGFNMARWVEEFGIITKLACDANPANKVFVSCASPPAWMKKNGAGTGANMSPGPIRTDDAGNAYNIDSHGYTAPGTGGQFDMTFAQHFCNMLIRSYQYIIAYGVPIEAVAVQNEPQTGGAYPTCQWTAADHTAFTRDYLRPALNAAGLGYIEIWTGETNQNETSGFVTPLLSNAGARAAVNAIALHNYGGTPADAAVLLDTYPEMKLHQTEWRTLNSQSFPSSHRSLWGDMVIGMFRGGALFDKRGYSTVSMFVLGLTYGGGPTSNNLDRRGVWTVGPGGVVYNPEHYMLTQVSRHTVVGGKRVSSSSFITGANQGDVGSVAFKNPDGSQTLHLFNGDSVNPKGVDVIDAVSGKKVSLTLAANEATSLIYSAATAGTKALAPTALLGSGAGNVGTLSWTLPSDPNRKAVALLRAATNGTPVVTQVLPPNTTSTVDSAVATGASYDYYVQGIGNGRSALSTKRAVTISGAAAPDPGEIVLLIAKPPMVGISNTLILVGKASGSSVEINTNDGQTLTTTTTHVAWTPATDGAVSATPTETPAGGSPHTSAPTNFDVASAAYAAANILIRDTFTLAVPGVPIALELHTPEVGGAWAMKSLNSTTRVMMIGDAGRIYVPGSALIVIYDNATTMPTQNFRVDGLLYGQGANSINNQVGIFLSSTGAAGAVTGYIFSYDYGTHQWRAYRVGNGTAATPDLILPVAPSGKAVQVGEVMPFTVIRTGTTMALYVDGELVQSFTEGTVATITNVEIRYNQKATLETTGVALTELQVTKIP